MNICISHISSCPARHLALSGKAEAVAAPVKGQAQAAFGPLDQTGYHGFGRFPQGPIGGSNRKDTI